MDRPDEWRSYGGGPSNTGYTPSSIPADGVERKWTFEVGEVGNVRSYGPVVSTDGNGKTLYAGCNASESVSVTGSFLQAIDGDSGEGRWRHETEFEIHS